MLNLASYEDSRAPVRRAIMVSRVIDVIIWDINITSGSKMGFRY